jgi:hypothetical protein
VKLHLNTCFTADCRYKTTPSPTVIKTFPDFVNSFFYLSRTVRIWSLRGELLARLCLKIFIAFGQYCGAGTAATLGWVNFDEKLFWIRVPLESILFYVKGPKTGDKVVEVTIGMRKGYDLLERYLIKVEKKINSPALSYIKRHNTLCRFQKYRLTMVTKCTYQRFFFSQKPVNLLFFIFLQLIHKLSWKPPLIGASIR